MNEVLPVYDNYPNAFIKDLCPEELAVREAFKYIALSCPIQHDEEFVNCSQEPSINIFEKDFTKSAICWPIIIISPKDDWDAEKKIKEIKENGYARFQSRLTHVEGGQTDMISVQSTEAAPESVEET